jgi:hypothetical protein
VRIADPTGESRRAPLRLDFDRRVMLWFRGSVITSDAGPLTFRELDAVSSTDMAGDVLADARTGRRAIATRSGRRREPVRSAIQEAGCWKA